MGGRKFKPVDPFKTEKEKVGQGTAEEKEDVMNYLQETFKR